MSSSLGKPVTVNKSTLVLSALLLIVVQQLITQWTVNAAGQRDVIDYISLAGTIVGILLGLLAIIYAFIAAAGQKDDADSVRTQITSLSETVSRANNASVQFASELTRLESIRSQLTSVSELARAHYDVTEEVRRQVVEMASKQQVRRTRRDKQEPNVAAAAAASVDKPTLPETDLATAANLDQLLLYFLTAAERQTHDSGDKNRMGEFSSWRNKFLREGLRFQDDEQENLAYHMLAGELIGYYLILRDLNVSGERLTAFMQAVLTKLDDVTLESSVFADDELQAKVDTAKEWIRNSLGV